MMKFRLRLSTSNVEKLQFYTACSTSQKHSQSILITVTNMLAPSTNSQVSIRKGLLAVSGHFVQRPALHTKTILYKVVLQNRRKFTIDYQIELAAHNRLYHRLLQLKLLKAASY